MKNIKSKTIYYIFAGMALMLFTVNISCEKEEEDQGDIINPYVISYNPVSGVGGVDLSSDLVLTFDDIVEIGTGNITITVADVPSATQVIDVTSDKVTLGNVARVMTINPQDFLSGREYQVVLDAGIVKDTAGNLFFGMPDNEEWKFTSGGNPGDLDAPELAETLPANSATDAAVTGIALTFNEEVKEGPGNITIYTSGGAVVATIDAEGDLITFDGPTASIALTSSLDFGTSYYVHVDDGAIKDIAGNNFTGISDDSTWAFTTTAGSGSDLVVHLPFDGSLADISGNRFDAVGKGDYKGVPVSHDFVTDGERGEVIKFNPGSFAQLPKHDLLRPGATQNFSVNLWVKLAGTDSDPAFIGNKNWDNGSEAGWLICTDDGHEYVPGDDNDGWSVNISDGNRTDWEAGDCVPTNAPSVSDDQWHMVTFTVDRPNGKLSVYIDGVFYTHPEGEDISVQTGPFYDETLDYPVTIWEDGTGVYNHGDDRRIEMTGLMDELSIYNKVLTQDDITALFNN